MGLTDDGKKYHLPLELPSGKKIKEAEIIVKKNDTVKQVKMQLLHGYLSKKNNYDTVLDVVLPNEEEETLDDESLMSKYEYLLKEAVGLEIKYISWTRVFQQIPISSGVNLGIGMVSGSPYEASVIGMHTEIRFPNGLIKKKQLFLLDNTVREVMHYLVELEDPNGDLFGPKDDLMMELHFVDKPSKEMCENETLKSYVPDIGESDYINIKKRSAVHIM